MEENATPQLLLPSSCRSTHSFLRQMQLDWIGLESWLSLPLHVWKMPDWGTLFESLINGKIQKIYVFVMAHFWRQRTAFNKANVSTPTPFSDASLECISFVGAVDRVERLLRALPAAERAPSDQWWDSQQCDPRGPPRDPKEMKEWVCSNHSECQQAHVGGVNDWSAKGFDFVHSAERRGRSEPLQRSF